MEDVDAAKFQVIRTNDIPIVQNVTKTNIFLEDIDKSDGVLVGELARRSLEKYSKSARLLRYKNHIWYLSTMVWLPSKPIVAHGVITSLKTENLEGDLSTCNDRVKHFFPEERLSAPWNTLSQTRCF